MKIVEEDVTTYQECLGSYLKKIFQRSDVVCNVFETQTKERYCTPPTPPTRNTPKKNTAFAKQWQQSRPPPGAPPPQNIPNFQCYPEINEKKKQPPSQVPHVQGPQASQSVSEKVTPALCAPKVHHTRARGDTDLAWRKIAGGIDIQKNIHQPSILG